MKSTDVIDYLNKSYQEMMSRYEELLQQPVSDAPEMEDIRDNIEIRYNSYAEVANRCKLLSEMISNAIYMKDACRQLRINFTRDINASTALNRNYIKSLDDLIENIENLIDSIKALKEGVDQMLKFYNSMQYLFGACLDVKSQY